MEGMTGKSVFYTGTVTWRLKGRWHREDGSAVEYVNGRKTRSFTSRIVDGPLCDKAAGRLRAGNSEGEFHSIDSMRVASPANL